MLDHPAISPVPLPSLRLLNGRRLHRLVKPMTCKRMKQISYWKHWDQEQRSRNRGNDQCCVGDPNSSKGTGEVLRRDEWARLSRDILRRI